MALILVTGSRTWCDRRLLGDTLLDIAATVQDRPGKRMALMHGTAGGADQLAAILARDWRWIVLDRVADWARGPLAGFERNGEMVAEAVDYQARGTLVRVAAFTMPCPQPCRRGSALCRGWTHGADYCGQLAEEDSRRMCWWIRPDGARDPLGVEA